MSDEQEMKQLRESSIQQEGAIGALNDELAGLARTVGQLATSFQEQNKETNKTISEAITDMRKMADGRASAEKSRMVSTIAIIVPVVIAGFALTLSISSKNSDRIEEITDSRVNQAYKDGLTAGGQIALTDRVAALEVRVGNNSK